VVGLTDKPPARARLRMLAAMLRSESNPAIAAELIRHAYEAADEAAAEPPQRWWLAAAHAATDAAAIGAFTVLGVRGVLDATAVGALILAVVAARLYPRGPGSVGPGGGGPPGVASGVVALLLGAKQLAGHLGPLARLRGA